ncbi:hypothetical protein [Pseudomonas syringae group genomosp. 7]|uniref:hypothetical protein n=1 Tax=Pseudomonas syringae group genomosp. 7 TaxID=251699 RepID=UPI000F009EE8|nr:hypothetical protein [Pseudomonas syringae group genomosp. 7]
MLKYLYGKKLYLNDWIEGAQGVRLSDIAHYSIMENELMRDDELAKSFVFDKEQVTFSINGVLLNAADMDANPVITIFPERCFCVCFSGKKNDPILFERFKSDVCVEVDIEKLVELLRVGLSRLEGVTVVHRDVNYYPAIMATPTPDLLSAVFYKRDIYAVEDEYRIAVMIPSHRRLLRGPEGKAVAIFSDDHADLRHMFVNGMDPSINTSYIVSITNTPLAK